MIAFGSRHCSVVLQYKTTQARRTFDDDVSKDVLNEMKTIGYCSAVPDRYIARRHFETVDVTGLLNETGRANGKTNENSSVLLMK